MADCIEALITANIKTALAAIKTANGYTWTPGAIEEERLFLSINNRFPYVMIQKDLPTLEPEANHNVQVKFRYIINLIDKGNDESETANTELTYMNRNVTADIIKALMSDHTRGGYAETTILTDMADGIVEGPSGAFYMAAVKIEVQALLDVLDPYQKG